MKITLSELTEGTINGSLGSSELHDLALSAAHQKHDKRTLDVVKRIAGYPYLETETIEYIINQFGNFKPVQNEIVKNPHLTTEHLRMLILRSGSSFAAKTLSRIFAHPNTTSEIIELLCEPTYQQIITLPTAARHKLTPSSILKEIYYTNERLRYDVVSNKNLPTSFIEAVVKDEETKPHFRTHLLKKLHEREPYSQYPFEWLESVYN